MGGARPPLPLPGRLGWAGPRRGLLGGGPRGRPTGPGRERPRPALPAAGGRLGPRARALGPPRPSRREGSGGPRPCRIHPAPGPGPGPGPGAGWGGVGWPSPGEGHSPLCRSAASTRRGAVPRRGRGGRGGGHAAWPVPARVARGTGTRPRVQDPLTRRVTDTRRAYVRAAAPRAATARCFVGEPGRRTGPRPSRAGQKAFAGPGRGVGRRQKGSQRAGGLGV